MILINGQQGNSIHVMDRGVMYGDGVFRTMRMRDGRVHCWLGQYRKLEADCLVLDILCPARSIDSCHVGFLSVARLRAATGSGRSSSRSPRGRRKV